MRRALPRRRISGTRIEAAAYLALVISLGIGALILSDIVLGVGAGIAALALFGALSARRREASDENSAGD